MALECLFHILFFASFSVSLFAVAFVVAVNFTRIACTRFRGHQSSAISAVQFARKVVRDVVDDFRINGIIRLHNADISLVVQYSRNLVRIKRLAVLCNHSFFIEFGNYVFLPYVVNIIVENFAYYCGLRLVQRLFFIDNFVAVNIISASKITFDSTLSQSALDILGKFSGIVFGIAFYHRFKKDSFGTV